MRAKSKDNNDIKSEDPLRVAHLHSLFMYTDFSVLCADFSALFRAVHRGESLASMKARNGSYHHFARCLKELVICVLCA